MTRNSQTKTDKITAIAYNRAAIFANWFRVGLIGLLALPSLWQIVKGTLHLSF